jgi:head-tail adaptor
MLRAGQLSERLRLYSRTEIDDGAGNRRGPFELRFEVWAEIRLRPGNEAFSAARVEGRVPADVRVRATPETLTIGTGWMARDERGVDWNVQAPSRDPGDRSALMFTMIAGGVIG